MAVLIWFSDSSNDGKIANSGQNNDSIGAADLKPAAGSEIAANKSLASAKVGGNKALVWRY